jgi:NAD(P)-dependent dehydrogenase (short-subunit alcohol dehydrogenase family)
MTDEIPSRNRSTIAVITGGTQGLGLAIAKRLALEGAPGIAISSRNAEKGEAAAASVRSLGTDCLFAKADVSNAEDCYRLVETALAHFGSVNGLVNSAGIGDRGTLLTPASSSGSGTSIQMPAAPSLQCSAWSDTWSKPENPGAS